ncbi:M56 family metallopeptidase [Luteibacter sp. SG786]|uniref:M56 family metallopeptidase n=1 Tax=Luteibacter sp. SG786 TaxID=2587130 RepID=UPI00141FC465|nr:M56 family metallopeptidase [Luteibacter sp. SG786]NII55135.1 hypothetical protein [Luteibacter sp. SG786]
MNALTVLTGCVCGVLVGTGMAAALARVQDGLSARVRHAFGSAAFWLTAALPPLLVCLGDASVTPNAQALWGATTAVFSDALPAQPWLATLARGLFCAWMAVAAAGMCRLARQVWRTAGLRRALRPSEVTWPAVATASVPGPMLIGYRRPVVVLPEMMQACAPGVVQALVRHEQAHAARWDNWRLLAENAAMALLPWCVPLRALHRMLAAAREELCDAMALRGADEPTRIGYAQALVHALRHAAKYRALGSTMSGPMSALRRRMDAILEPSCAMASPPWRQRGMAGMALSTGALAAALMWCIGGGLETVAGLHGMTMRFAPLDGTSGVYRVTTLGGPAETGTRAFAPGPYQIRFARTPSGEWVVTTRPAARP